MRKWAPKYKLQFFYIFFKGKNLIIVGFEVPNHLKRKEKHFDRSASAGS